MTGQQFASYIRKQTKTNSTTLPDADLVLLANIVKDDIAKRITKANEDYFGIWMTRNLVAGQRNYAFEPEQMNHMKYLEAKIDGTTWCRLREYDINQLHMTSDEASIQSYFAARTPGFDIFGNELVLYSGTPIIDVTDGLKLWTIVYPSDITALTLASTDDLSIAPSTTSFGFPRQFHKVWADTVVVEYKNSQDKPLPLTENEQRLDARFQDALNDIKGGNLDREVLPSEPYDDGSDY